MTSPYIEIGKRFQSQRDTTYSYADLFKDKEPIDDYDANIIEEDNPFFLKKAWDFSKFFTKSIFDTSSEFTRRPSGSTVEAFSSGVRRSVDEVFDTIKNKSIGEFFSDQAGNLVGFAGALADDPLSTLNSFANGLIDFFVETPVEALTGSKNVKGEIVPMTPEEHSLAVQQTIANLGNFLIQRGLTSKMLKAPVGRASMNVTKMGMLGKTLAANAAASAASSAITEPLAQLGQEDYISKVVSNTLVSATAGTVLGSLFDIPRYNKAVQNAQLEFRTAQNTLVNARAAAAFLQNNPNKTPAQITAAIQAVLAGDDIVEAAVRSGLHQKGFVVPKFTPDEGEALLGKMKAAPLGPIEYELPSKFKARLRPTYSGIPITWENPFDLVAYHAQANGFVKNPELMTDVMTKTGVTKEQLIAHGKFVKSKLKEMQTGGLMSELTQNDIDFLRAGYIERGREMLNKARNGDTLVDINNRQWIKTDDNFIVSGNERVNINSITNYEAFGTPKVSPGSLLNKKFILPKQEFNGDFNRNAETVDITYGPNGEAYIHASPLTEEARELFERTGFLPMETVTIRGSQDRFYVTGFQKKPSAIILRGSRITGKGETDLTTAFRLRTELEETLKTDNKVMVRGWDAKTSQWIEKSVDATDIVRDPSGSSINTYEFENQKMNMKAGILNQQTFAKAFIDRFSAAFKNRILTRLAAGKEAPTIYDVFDGVGKEMNIPKETLNELRTIAYNKIGDDLVTLTLEPEEGVMFKLMRQQMEEATAKEELNAAGFFRQLAERNGYYVIDNGQALEIRDISNDALVFNAPSMRAGIDFMSRSGRMPLPTYDGALPADILKLGNLSTVVSLADGKISQMMDLLNTNTIGFNFVPIRNLWASVANNIERLGVKTNIFKRIEDVNDSLARRRIFYSQNQPLMTKFKAAVAAAEGLTGDQLDHINRIMQTMTADEIKTGYLSRPMNQIEIDFATDLASRLAAINETITSVSNVYLAGVKEGRLGSVEFRDAILNAMDAGRINPEVGKIVIDFSDRMLLHGEDTFAPHAVLKLANAVQFPSQALSFADYARTSGISPQAVDVATRLIGVFEDAGNAAGIPEAKRLGAYLPQIAKNDAFSTGMKDIKLPEGFARELNRVLEGRRDLVSNPLTLAFTYINSVANHKAGIADAMRAVKKEIIDETSGVAVKLSGLNDAAATKQAEFVVKLYERYQDAVMGYPDLSDKARQAMRSLGSKMFKRNLKDTFSSGSLLALIDSAYVGAQPLQALRDVVTAISASTQLFGLKFTSKALIDGMSFTAKELNALEVDLKIPHTMAQDLLAPDTDYASGAAMGIKKGAISKAQEIGMTLSGQHYVYVRTLAGIYKHTSELVYDLLGKAQRREISLEDAIKKLQIDVHNPAVQRQFLAYANAGDIEGAARHLGKWNGKLVANNYGEMQSPISWRKGIGKYMGQFGSWGANMLQVQLDAHRNFGSAGWEASFKRLARLGMITSGIMLVGNEVGLDLKNMLFTPVQAAPGVGPVVSLFEDIRENSNLLFSTDESMRSKGLDKLGRLMVPFYPNVSDIGKAYIPMSYQMQRLFKATEAWDSGSDPFEIAATAIGLKMTQ